MLNWVDKVDNVDDVKAEDINTVAREVNKKQDEGNYAEIDKDNVFVGSNAFYGDFVVKGRDILNELDNKAGQIDVKNLRIDVEGNLWEMLQTFNEVNGNLDRLDNRVTDVEENVSNLNNKVEGNLLEMQQTFNEVNGNLDGLDNRVTDVEERVASVENRVQEEIDDKADALILDSEKATALVLTDTKEAPLVDYKIYGNSTQDGTPSLDNPVEVVSVGTLVEDEANEHYGKYEIPVTVSGNDVDNVTYYIYLDEPLRRVGDYQDYIDFKNKKVVRRIKNMRTRPSTWNSWSSGGNGRRVMSVPSGKLYGKGLHTLGHSNRDIVFQNIYDRNQIAEDYPFGFYAYQDGSNVYWYADYTKMGLDGSEDISIANSKLKEWTNEDKNAIYFTYVLAAPTETPITDLPEILTNYPTTTITCDGEVQVIYKADTTNAYNNLKNKLDELTQAIISVGGTL